MPRRPPPSLFDIYLRQAERATTPPKRRRRQPASSIKQRAIAKRAEPKISRAVVKAAKAAQAGTSTRAVRDAIQRQAIAEAVAAVPWDEAGRVLTAEHAEVFRDTFEAAAQLEAGRLGTSFDVLNDNSVRFMAEKGGEFVRELGTLQQSELREALTEMLRRGMSTREAADLFKESIGLTTRLNEAVLNYREKLSDKGIGGDRLERMVAAKAEKLLRYRANLVAQTEAQNAATAGQQATWNQAEADGLLDVATFEQEWVTSSKPCPLICEPADGQRRSLNELFILGDGRAVKGPGGEAHPGCVCTLVGHANRQRREDAA
jgi:hypothetical protein